MRRPTFEAAFGGGEALAALLTQWGVLVIVLYTRPVRPYTDGAWAASDVFSLIALGALVALASRGWAGLCGVVLGMAGAVAIQLSVLTAQASYSPDVVASLGRGTWLPHAATGLVGGLVAIVAGYAVVRAALSGLALSVLRERRWPPAPGGRAGGSSSGWSGRRLAQAAVIVGAVLVVGTLLADASTSAYVPPAIQQTITVTVRDDRITGIEPATIRSGRVALSAVRTGSGAGAVNLTAHLSTDQQVALDAGWIDYGNLRAQVLAPEIAPVPSAARASGASTATRQVDFAEPGVYGVVVSSPTWQPPSNWDGRMPVLDAGTIAVTAAGGGEAMRRPGDTGPLQPLGGLAGVLIAGWGSCGAVVGARRPRRSLVLGPVVGIAVAGLLQLLVVLAIAQSHSPF